MSRPAFSICLCPDSRLLQNRLDALLAAHPPSGGGAWQRFVFWGDEGIAPAFWEHLTLQGLFAVPKALVLRHAENLSADTLHRELSPALMPLAPPRGAKPASPLVWPFICLEVAFEKGKPKVPAHIQRLDCYARAADEGWLDAAPPLSGQNMVTFIRTEAARLRLHLHERDVAMLTGCLPPDAARVSGELEKLALLAGPDGRPPADAAAVLADASSDMSVFELMRLVQQNDKAPAAWRRILEDRLSGENTVFAFIAILLREARLLWQTLAGSSVHLPHQAAMQKKIAAQNLGFAGLARLWDIALQADKGIKSGERSPDQAFEMLAADLFILFSRSRRQ